MASHEHATVPECEPMLRELYAAFETAQEHPQRWRMYALVVMGGGQISELRDHCAMPLGSSLARFEVHWDEAGSDEEAWSRRFIDRVHQILRSSADVAVGRPYRGDIWRADQASDARLDDVLRRYDRRPRPVAIESGDAPDRGRPVSAPVAPAGRR